jgi:hypothetical protein
MLIFPERFTPTELKLKHYYYKFEKTAQIVGEDVKSVQDCRPPSLKRRVSKSYELVDDVRMMF